MQIKLSLSASSTAKALRSESEVALPPSFPILSITLISSLDTTPIYYIKVRGASLHATRTSAPVIQVRPPGYFTLMIHIYIFLYNNHAHRLRLEKLLRIPRAP